MGGKRGEPRIFAKEAAHAGVKLGEVIDGSRQRADGVVLSWRFTDPRTVAFDGLIPFFIDWGKTPHPAVPPHLDSR